MRQLASARHCTVGYAALVVLGAALIALLLNACGDDSRSSTVAGTPTPPGQVATSSSPNLTREQALAIASEVFTKSHSLATAVENPHDTMSRLMRLRELREAASIPEFDEHRDTLVWIVQVEGTSRPPAENATTSSGQPLVYRFNAVAIDAETGDVISRMQSEYEPFILPIEFLPKAIVNAGLDERNIQRDSLPVSRDEAVDIVLARYGNQRTTNRDAIETSLVMFSNPVLPGDSSVGPLATATPVSTYAAPTSTSGPSHLPMPETTPHVRVTNTPVVNRLSWLVIMPSELSFRGCFISGPPGESHLTCWMSVPYFFVDTQTGDIYLSDGLGFIGPALTKDESLALQHFAWAEGWWALWHKVHQYNGTRLPDGLAATLDRPDAPTPTPFPSTPTPPVGTTPTPIPTPPTPTPTPRVPG
jgi:hypothetical protein